MRHLRFLAALGLLIGASLAQAADDTTSGGTFNTPGYSQSPTTQKPGSTGAGGATQRPTTTDSGQPLRSPGTAPAEGARTDQVPELRREFFDRFPRRGYGAALTWLRRVLRARHAEVDDPESLAAVIFGGLVHLHLMEVTFNRAPPETDRERYLETWVDSTLAMLPAGRPAPEKEAVA